MLFVDKYSTLVDGRAAAEVADFLDSNRSFDDYTEVSPQNAVVYLTFESVADYMTGSFVAEVHAESNVFAVKSGYLIIGFFLRSETVF